MRTTIDIPDPLFRRMKAKAAMEGTSLKALVAGYIEYCLDRRTDLSPTTKPDRSPPPLIRAATGTPLSVLSNTEIYDILEQEDIEQAGRD